MNETTNEAPIISPGLLVGLSAAALIIALAVAFTQATFGVIGWVALVVAILSLAGAIIVAPQQFLNMIRGRNVAFGGTSIIVTLLLVVAMVAAYTALRGFDLRYDVTQKDEYSLSENSRQAIAAFASDPNLPGIKIVGFYDVTQAGNKDRDTVLLDDYKKASNGKITYEFLDYDQNVLLAEQYKVTSPGQLSVVAINPDGQPALEQAELVSFLNQEELTNAIMRAAASGDFRAYFLSVENGLEIDDTGETGLSGVNSVLTDSFNWTTQQVSVVDLLSGEVKLDEESDGTVLIIPGGSSALTDEAAQFIQNYLNNGGEAIIMADIPAETDKPSLATAENMNSYFAQNYGVSFGTEIVLDQEQAFQSPLRPYAIDFDTASPITAELSQTQSVLVFERAFPLTVADTTPENVTVTPLVRSGVSAFTKTIDELVAQDQNPNQQDPVGPFILAASAENTATDSRVLFIGSTYPMNNISQVYASATRDIANFDFSLIGLVWATRFNEFFTDIPQIAQQFRVQDTPIIADTETLRWINLGTLALPFAVLAVGFIVWRSRRERALKES